MSDILSELRALADARYRAFQTRLMPTVAPERVLGVRLPALNKLCARLADSPEARAFLLKLPHDYYDEDMLHALFIRETRDFNAALNALNAFLMHVDNWAVCDALRVKAFKARPEALMPHIEKWLRSPRAYTRRFAVVTLIYAYAGEGFRPEHMALVAGAQSDEYYVNAAIAWYFATILTYHYDAALGFLSEGGLSEYTFNKAIQKARESLLVPMERKEALKRLKTQGGYM